MYTIMETSEYNFYQMPVCLFQLYIQNPEIKRKTLRTRLKKIKKMEVIGLKNSPEICSICHDEENIWLLIWSPNGKKPGSKHDLHG